MKTTDINKHNAGFSLPEMILTVAVLAILVTISFSTIFQFLDQQRFKEEEKDLAEIKKAMEAMVRDIGELPVDADDPSFDVANDWADQLARYSNLSAEDFRTDNWERQREYRVLIAPEVFRDAEFDVYYASVFSTGSDGENSVNTTLSSGAGGIEWWDEELLVDDAVTQYGAIELGEDDLIAKFTDYKIKTENYFRTAERLERISEALETYAQVKLNEALVDNEAQRQTNLDCGTAAGVSVDPDTGLRDDNGVLCAAAPGAGAIPYPTVSEHLFYPPSQARLDGAGGGDAATYNEKTTQDADPFIGTNDDPATWSPATDLVGNPDDNQDRKTAMVSLMRLLGLPDSYCCNALQLVDDVAAAVSGTTMENPFFYFSNPRPRGTLAGVVTCGARPATPPFLPPRITVEYQVDDGAGTPDDPPTCG